MFHSGTVLHDGKLRTAGGRVLTVAAVRATLREAVEAAYRGANRTTFQ
jgi:phosphoribosylamine-glycine ligase